MKIDVLEETIKVIKKKDRGVDLKALKNRENRGQGWIDIAENFGLKPLQECQKFCVSPITALAMTASTIAVTQNY